MGDQAEALDTEPHEISAIETGKSPIPAGYLHNVISWLNLNEQEQRDLFKRVESNVVALRRHTGGGDKTSAMRLFRKISKMNPNEIRDFRKKPPPEAKNDGRF